MDRRFFVCVAASVALAAPALAASGDSSFVDALLRIRLEAGQNPVKAAGPKLVDGPAGQDAQDKISKLEDFFIGISLLDLYVAEQYQEAVGANLAYFTALNLSSDEIAAFKDKLAAVRTIQDSLVKAGVLKKVQLPPQAGGGEALVFALAGQKPSAEAVAETWRYRAAVNALNADQAGAKMKAVLDKLNAEGPDEEVEKVPHALVAAYVRYDEVHQQVQQLSGLVLEQLSAAVAENGGNFESRWGLRIAPPKP